MKGTIKKQMNRLFGATAIVRTYPEWMGYEDEVRKTAKPMSGKYMRRLLAGMNYSRVDGDGLWAFASRPKFNPNREYILYWEDKGDDGQELTVVPAGRCPDVEKY